MKQCSVTGCDSKLRGAKGLCNKHYLASRYSKEKRRLQKKEDPEKVRQRSRDWYKDNPEKANARGALYYVNNKEHLRECNREWRALNIDQAAENRRLAEYAKLHPEVRRATVSRSMKKTAPAVNARTAKRRAKKLKATPKWANQFFIKEIYDLANRRTKIMGFKWHVDHIVPLVNPLVCGLHCEQNLQVMPAVQNHSKNNRWWPDMP